MKEAIGGIAEDIIIMTKKDYSDSKWKQAIRKAFPDSAPPNIVMTADTVREDQEKLRRAIEAKRGAEAQNPQQSQIDALRAMAAQQNDAMRRQQMAQGMQNIAQQQYGVSSFPFGFGQASSSPFNFPTANRDEIEAKPKREAKPKVPDKTTEQAQEELTGIGKRKIILDEEK